MSIYFAPAQRSSTNPLYRALTGRGSISATNDNTRSLFHTPGETARPVQPVANCDAATGEPTANAPDVERALRHFAKHGMQSAPAAWDKAVSAYKSDDMDGYWQWLEVCRMFDGPYSQRMARSHAKDTADDA